MAQTPSECQFLQLIAINFVLCRQTSGARVQRRPGHDLYLVLAERTRLRRHLLHGNDRERPKQMFEHVLMNCSQADVGQPDDFEQVKKQALQLGAIKVQIMNPLRE